MPPSSPTDGDDLCSIRILQNHMRNTPNKESAITLEQITKMLLTAYEKAAQDTRGASAMISAAQALTKLYGLPEDPKITRHKDELRTFLSDIQKARNRLKNYD